MFILALSMCFSLLSGRSLHIQYSVLTSDVLTNVYVGHYSVVNGDFIDGIFSGMIF